MTKEQMANFHKEIATVIRRNHMDYIHMKVTREMDRIGEEWQA